MVTNATIRVTNVGTNITQTSTTNSAGEYNVLNLQPAGYKLEVTAPGLSGYIQTGITLDVDQKASIDVALELGATSSTVTVAADANQVEATDVTLSDVVTGSEIPDRTAGRRVVCLLEDVRHQHDAPG